MVVLPPSPQRFRRDTQRRLVAEFKTMVAMQGTHLIDSAAAEAFAQLAKTVDKFERYENPHAQRIATIADEIASTVAPERTSTACVTASVSGR